MRLPWSSQSYKNRLVSWIVWFGGRIKFLCVNYRRTFFYGLLHIWYRLKLPLPSSQFGEDLILNYLIRKPKWLYVDVGANDPWFGSNTYLFYNKWRDGISIEPNKKIYKRIQKYRPRATNIHAAVWNTWSLTYYEIDVNWLSTCSADVARSYEQLWHTIAHSYKVPVKQLGTIFDEYLHGRTIDILSVDVEWMEMDVLSSNNREKYKPHYIILETVVYQGDDKPWTKNNKQYDEYLHQFGYIVIADTYANTIYQLRDVKNQ